jgi:hypothetical protein
MRLGTIQRRTVGRLPAIKGLSDTFHLLGNLDVAHPALPQRVLHIQAKPVKNLLPHAANGCVLAREAIEQKRGVQQDHLETAVNRVGNTVVKIEYRMARLCHDGAIEGFNGGRSAGTAGKQGQNHRVLIQRVRPGMQGCHRCNSEVGPLRRLPA